MGRGEVVCFQGWILLSDGRRRPDVRVLYSVGVCLVRMVTNCDDFYEIPREPEDR
jgi:hypothetical protein